MKFYDEIRLAVREGKKCLPYLVITALLYAIVSAVASCLFLTAVNLRRDYSKYLDEQSPHGHEFYTTCKYTIGAETKLSECGFDKVVHLSSADYDARFYVSESGEKIEFLQCAPLYFIEELLGSSSVFSYEIISGTDIQSSFDTPEANCIWIDEYIAQSESLPVGDKLCIKNKGKMIKEYNIAGIYNGDNTVFMFPVIIPFYSYYDCAVTSGQQIDSSFSCTLNSMTKYDSVIPTARQNGFDIDTRNFEDGIIAINYAYVLFAGLAVLFTGIALFSITNTFSVTIAKRSHIMTNYMLLGARRRNIYAIYFIPYFSSIVFGAVIGSTIMCQLFSYISSLTKELFFFEVILEAENGAISILSFALVFISILAVMLYFKFRALTRISLAEKIRECDR